MQYDYLILGSGMFGSVFAYEATKSGKKCLVIDKRNHIGGNCYTHNINGIHCALYGIHIFNTNNESIWKYINQFCEFEQYIHKVKVNYKNLIYGFPVNLMTLYPLWGCVTPQDAENELDNRRITKDHCINLQDWVISELGEEIFETFYKGYSEKQWMRDCTEIPASIGKRLPIRLNYDDNYHRSKYCGIPKDGNYTQIFEKMLDGCEVKLNTGFDHNWRKYAKKLVYTGAIDEFFNYKYGPLEYRSLSFDTKVLPIENFQGVSQMNYTDRAIPWTRIIEHKWLSPKHNPNTVVTYEYPAAWTTDKERYYPVNNKETNEVYSKYKAEIPDDVVISGRLGAFKYLDMTDCVTMALKTIQKEIISPSLL